MMTRNRRLGRKWWLTICKNAVCQAEPPARPIVSFLRLTPLRGIAALWVVLYHYCGQSVFRIWTLLHYSSSISKGYLAVDIFFMLSGFVMTHVYHRAFSDNGSCSTIAASW